MVLTGVFVELIARGGAKMGRYPLRSDLKIQYGEHGAVFKDGETGWLVSPEYPRGVQPLVGAQRPFVPGAI
jgi:hypothetical protein